MTQAGRALTESQREWLRIRHEMRERRFELSHAVAALYPHAVKVEATPLLSSIEWLPVLPLPLADVELELVADPPAARITGREPAARPVLPIREDGSRYTSYAEAMADLAAPTVFENRPTYRLLDTDLSAAPGRLVFGEAGTSTGSTSGSPSPTSTPPMSTTACGLWSATRAISPGVPPTWRSLR